MLAVVLGILLLCLDLAAAQVPYDIVYVRAARRGDTTFTRIAEVFFPMRGEPGSDLMLLHPDGSQEVLVSAGPDGMILDPVVSFDAQWVYYAKFPNVRLLNPARGNGGGVPVYGADLWKIHLVTRQTVRLTFGEWTPTPTIANWATDPSSQGPPPGKNSLGHGIYNTGPCPLPGNKLMFTSSRNGLTPVKPQYTYPLLQLFVLDETTGIVEQVGYLNLGGALHPVVLTDGRIMFSSGETQGRRDPRVWALWAMYPDGRNWEPLFSAFFLQTPLHWQVQRSDGVLGVIGYYILNNAGMGPLFGLDFFPRDMPMAPSIPRFGDPVPAHPSNPVLEIGYAGANQRTYRVGLSPLGLRNLTPFAHHLDIQSDLVSGMHMGKVTQPSSAPGSDMLLVYSPGPDNAKNHPTYDMGIYLLKNGTPAYTPTDLVLVKNDPAYNEQQPKAVVPYKAIYGIDTPPLLPWLPNTGTLHAALPEGTPHGLVGTSTFYKRNTAPGVPSQNWVTQGADAGTYTSTDIHAVRVLLMEPQSLMPYGQGGHVSAHFQQPYVATGTRIDQISERFKILGEIPLRKFTPTGQPILDVDGNPDTSFLAKIPADHVFTFQTLDTLGHALNTSQTWHQVRPGEARTDCGGCHAHSQAGTAFASTAAGQPGFVPADLTTVEPWTVEYKDIEAILAARCADCAGLTPQQIAIQFSKPFESRLSPLVLSKLDASTPEPDKRLVRIWIDLGSPVSMQPKALIQNTSPWRERNTRPTLHLQVVRTPPASCPAGCVSNVPGSAVLSIGAFAYGGVAITQVASTASPGADFGGQVAQTEHPGIWHLPLPGTGQAVFTVRVQDAVGLWTEKRLAATW